MTKQATTEQKKEVLDAIRSRSPSLSFRDACAANNITKSTFYNWCKQEGAGTLEPKSRKPNSFGNQIAPEIQKLILEVHQEDPAMSAHDVYLFLKSANIKVSYSTVKKIIRLHYS